MPTPRLNAIYGIAIEVLFLVVMVAMLILCFFTRHGPDDLFGKLWTGSAVAFFVFVGLHLLWRRIPRKSPG